MFSRAINAKRGGEGEGSMAGEDVFSRDGGGMEVCLHQCQREGEGSLVMGREGSVGRVEE